MTCINCVLAFVGVKGRNWFSTIVAPVLGAALNIAMLVGVGYYDTVTQGPSITKDTLIAIAFSLVWLVGGFAYLFIRKAVKGVPILHGEDHKEKLGVAAEVVAGD